MNGVRNGFRVAPKKKATLLQAAQLAERAALDVHADLRKQAAADVIPAQVGAKWALILASVALVLALTALARTF